MTKESMIKVLRYKAEHIKTRIKPEFFLEVADALGQQSEDAISRQETIKYLNTNMAWYDEDGEMADSDEKLKAITDLINGVPSVQPKTGHWIEYTRILIPEPINKWEQAWYCSECGYGNQECEDGSAWLEWKYCPNCGAKMIEPQAGK